MHARREAGLSMSGHYTRGHKGVSVFLLRGKRSTNMHAESLRVGGEECLSPTCGGALCSCQGDCGAGRGFLSRETRQQLKAQLPPVYIFEFYQNILQSTKNSILAIEVTVRDNRLLPFTLFCFVRGVRPAQFSSTR